MPDLNACDRWMNNKFVKKQLNATNFHEIDDLLVAVRNILSETLFKEELQKIIRQCDHVIERNGDYTIYRNV